MLLSPSSRASELEAQTTGIPLEPEAKAETVPKRRLPRISTAWTNTAGARKGQKKDARRKVGARKGQKEDARKKVASRTGTRPTPAPDGVWWRCGVEGCAFSILVSDSNRPQKKYAHNKAHSAGKALPTAQRRGKHVISTAFKKMVPRKPLSTFPRWLWENECVLKTNTLQEARAQFEALPEEDRRLLESRCAETQEEFKQKRTITHAAPKKPLSSYHLFCAENQAEVMQAAEGRSRGAQWKEAAQLWKSLPEQPKKVYKEKYAALLEIYSAELRAFKEAKKQRRACKAAALLSLRTTPTTPTKPKKPLNPYMHFAEEMRDELQEKFLKKPQAMSFMLPSVAKETGRLWWDLSDEERQMYQDRANRAASRET